MLEAAEGTVALLDDEDFAAGVAGDEEVFTILAECEANGAEATLGCKEDSQ